jgi:hypothetical protein
LEIEEIREQRTLLMHAKQALLKVNASNARIR